MRNSQARYREHLSRKLLREFRDTDVSHETGLESRRERRARLRFFPSRRRHFIERGWPKECAVFLAALGVPVHPLTKRDKNARRLERLALSRFKEHVRIAIEEEYMDEDEAIALTLEMLANKNQEEGRSPYNVFTLVSP